MICPNCNGTKKSGPAFVRYTHGCKLEQTIPCTTCNGIGTVHDDYPKWKAIGKRMYDERVSRGLSLGEEARRRGLRPSELSGMEHGKIEPIVE